MNVVHACFIYYNLLFHKGKLTSTWKNSIWERLPSFPTICFFHKFINKHARWKLENMVKNCFTSNNLLFKRKWICIWKNRHFIPQPWVTSRWSCIFAFHQVILGNRTEGLYAALSEMMHGWLLASIAVQHHLNRHRLRLHSIKTPTNAMQASLRQRCSCCGYSFAYKVWKVSSCVMPVKIVCGSGGSGNWLVYRKLRVLRPSWYVSRGRKRDLSIVIVLDFEWPSWTDISQSK